MKPETKTLIEQAARGIAEFTDGPYGISPHRLPHWTTSYHDIDQLTQQVANQASGARLALLTSATRIELAFHATRDSGENGLLKPSAVTLTVGDLAQTFTSNEGDIKVWDATGTFKLRKGGPSMAVFELPETDEPRLVDIWLPHNSFLQILDLTANAPLAAAPRDQKRWVHYGSSISHCMEADEPIGAWPVVAARSLNLDLYSLGLAGSANLEYFAARVIADLPAELITIKVGINTVNGGHLTRRVFVPAVHSFIEAIRAKQPNTPIILISPIYCGAHENSPGPTRMGIDGKITGSAGNGLDWTGELTLVMIRQLLADIVARRQDPNLSYLSGLELFGQADADLLPDGLHPNPEGYRLMGQRFTALAPQL
jgi:lysophospholipase L1-like esterase